jgi:alkanesulfonate monooxygenase SsuD/methylene tetrahydromethanopterin reductase-like flavin-dependent oxidoreductase (luciferase family)
VRNLCTTCKQKRQRVLARRRARRQRNDPENTGVYLKPDAVETIAEAIRAFEQVEAAILHRLALQGAKPRPETQTLFDKAADIRNALAPITAAVREELIELQRPGGRRRRLG